MKDIKDIDIDIEEEESKELVVQRTVDQALSLIEGLTVESNEQYETAASNLKKLRDSEKFVEKQYADELEAAKEKKKAADAERKAIVDRIEQWNKPLKAAEKQVRSMIEAYQNELEKKRREEEEKRREKAEKQRKEAEEKGKAVEPAEEEVVPDTSAPRVEGVSFYESWNYEIEDVSNIPREFMMPDEKKIRGYVQSMKGDGGIPGIRIYSEKKSRVR